MKQQLDKENNYILLFRGKENIKQGKNLKPKQKIVLACMGIKLTTAVMTVLNTTVIDILMKPTTSSFGQLEIFQH